MIRLLLAEVNRVRLGTCAYPADASHSEAALPEREKL
jgi:hypothetical protein